jgi:hypothetical protein
MKKNGFDRAVGWGGGPKLGCIAVVQQPFHVCFSVVLICMGRLAGRPQGRRRWTQVATILIGIPARIDMCN